MIEQFVVFHRGGKVLWKHESIHLDGKPLNALVEHVLLEERVGQTSYVWSDVGTPSLKMNWVLDNEHRLVFVAVYKSILNLQYINKLLEMVKREFITRYAAGKTSDGFESIFIRIVEGLEDEQRAKGQPSPASVDSPSEELLKSRAVSSSATKPVSDNVGIDGAKSTAAFDLSKLKQKQTKATSKPSLAQKQKVTSTKSDTKKPKEQRKWTDAESEEKLDFSSKKEHDIARKFDTLAVSDAVSTISRDSSLSAMDLEDTIYETEDFDEIGQTEEGGQGQSWLNSMVQSLQGKKILTDEDISPVLQGLKSKLLSKNVAEEIAEKLCESTRVSLVGKRLESFSLVSTAVKRSLEDSITRILTPNKSIDILRQVQISRDKGQPYIIVFIGVNGVGKSTNLAKVAYWLLQHKQKVMIAACDTFRSGAVEQLRIHCTRLQIPLFERGYEKDPALVAADAAKQAKLNNMDVLLVDTAGRMQDNEPLMRSLARLIGMNNPNLVLFVGEALVGNDAVDQLSKFNERLTDLCASNGVTKIIDGILLTKFDTIDDKMGAALSMVYTSQAPIIFVGCGQTYTDLKRLNVKHVVHALLK